MSRLGLLLVLIIVMPARADRMPSAGFDSALAAKSYAAAFEFIPPRALDPVTIPELALWGLHGLAAVDPGLSVAVRQGTIVLLGRGGVLLTVVAPAPDDSLAWSAAVVAVTEMAWKASAAFRQAGTGRVMRAFFEGMLSHLDPYSRYVPPFQADEEEEEREGQAGVGLTLEASPGGAVVVARVIPDGPAGLAGIRSGDRILSVNGDPTHGVPASDVESWLAGSDGTDVVLELAKGRARRTVTLTRMDVPEENVFAFRDGAALLVRISTFNTRTAARLAATIASGFTARQRPSGIVLDLRGNRGGLLQQAASTAEELLPPGLVARTLGRDPAADHVFAAQGAPLEPDVPLIVLVDGRTASAAEVLAAALADRSRAVVVGSSTLGKGLVQIVTRLPDGGELLLTWSRILAPRGWPIQGLGVLPQVCTSLGEPAVQKQLAALKAGRQPLLAALMRERRSRPPVRPAEMVAIRDACPAAEGTDLDLRTARLLLADPAAYAAALLPPMSEVTRSAGR